MLFHTRTPNLNMPCQFLLNVHKTFSLLTPIQCSGNLEARVRSRFPFMLKQTPHCACSTFIWINELWCFTRPLIHLQRFDECDARVKAILPTAQTHLLQVVEKRNSVVCAICDGFMFHEISNESLSLSFMVWSTRDT